MLTELLSYKHSDHHWTRDYDICLLLRPASDTDCRLVPSVSEPRYKQSDHDPSAAGTSPQHTPSTASRDTLGGMNNPTRSEETTLC